MNLLDLQSKVKELEIEQEKRGPGNLARKCVSARQHIEALQ